MRKRIGLVLPAIVLVLAAATALVLRSALPPDRVRTLVASRLQSALGHPVEIGSVHVGFTPLLVRAGGIRVSAPAGSEAPDLLRVRSLELHPRLLPLLRRQIAVRSIRIVELELWFEQRADGTWNWTPPAGAAPSPAAQPAGGSPLALAIDQLDLTGGRLHFHSALTAISASTPLAASIELSADRAWRDVHVSGWALAESLVTGGKLRGARLGRVRLEPDVHVDVLDSSARLERIRIWINDAPVEVTGTVRQRGGKPEFHLTTRSDGLDLAKLLAALPPDAPQTAGLRAAGNVRFEMRADALPGGLPVAHGFVELRDGMVQAAGLPEKISALTARVVMAGDSLRLESLSAQIGQAPVQVSGLILEPASPKRARYDVRITAELDLTEVARVAPLEPGVTLAGHATVDLRARGRAARPDSVALEGPVVLRDVVVNTPLLRVPVRAQARLQGAGTQLRIESASLQAAASTLTLTGTITPALPPRRPRLILNAKSERLDLAALLPAARPATAADTAAATHAPAVAPLLPALPPYDYELQLSAREVVLEAGTLQGVQLSVRGGPAAADVDVRATELRADQVVLRNATGTLQVANQQGRGTLRAERALLQKIEATALESDLEIAGTTVRLPTMRAASYGGALQGKAAVELANPAAPKYDIDMQATHLDVNAFLGSVTPLRNVITGTIDLESAWAFAGPEPATVRKTLTGKGQAASLNGRVQELPLLAELATLLQLPSLRTLPYRDLGMQFAVDAGRMTLQNFAIHAPDADVGIGGSIGLDGALDLALEVRLSPELSKRAMAARGTGALTALFADPQGRVLFDVKAGGTGRAPKLRLDLDRTKTRGGLTALSDAAVQRFIGGLLSRDPGAPAPAPGTAAGPPADATEAGRRALENARKKLGGKLGGLLGGPAKSDSSKKN